jgi:hypothetical protein
LGRAGASAPQWHDRESHRSTSANVERKSNEIEYIAALLAQAGPLPCDTEMCRTDERRSVVAGKRMESEALLSVPCGSGAPETVRANKAQRGRGVLSRARCHPLPSPRALNGNYGAGRKQRREAHAVLRQIVGKIWRKSGVARVSSFADDLPSIGARRAQHNGEYLAKSHVHSHSASTGPS